MGYRYWDNYYYTPKKPKQVKDGLKTKSQRGEIGETWWSKRWIAVLESFHMGARLDRGRRYARKGQVVKIDIKSGEVSALVQGTASRPYKITIRLKPLSERDWDKVADAMASQAIFAAKLLAGEMPKNIEEAFEKVKVSLFPTKSNDLKTHCSCPDWANPCKHIAAVYYLLAECFDEDPFMIFKLRGRTKEKIISELKQKRTKILEASDELQPSMTGKVQNQKPKERAITEYFANFWDSGKELDTFAIYPTPPIVDKAILKRLGQPSLSDPDQNRTLIESLNKIYDKISSAALKKANDESKNKKNDPKTI